MVAVTEPHSSGIEEAKQGISCAISKLQIDERDAQDIGQDSQGQSGRAEQQHYSGERKLLGIGMLHKSNLVPVFDQQDAIDISKMRRN
jgi:hypothetical protein